MKNGVILLSLIFCFTYAALNTCFKTTSTNNKHKQFCSFSTKYQLQLL